MGWLSGKKKKKESAEADRKRKVPKSRQRQKKNPKTPTKDDATIETRVTTPLSTSNGESPSPETPLKQKISAETNEKHSIEKSVTFSVEDDTPIKKKKNTLPPPPSMRDLSLPTKAKPSIKKAAKKPAKKDTIIETNDVINEKKSDISKEKASETPAKESVDSETKGTTKSPGGKSESMSTANNKSTVTAAKSYNAPVNKAPLKEVFKAKTNGVTKAEKAPVNTTPIKESTKAETTGVTKANNDPVNKDAKTETRTTKSYKTSFNTTPIKEAAKADTTGVVKAEKAPVSKSATTETNAAAKAYKAPAKDVVKMEANAAAKAHKAPVKEGTKTETSSATETPATKSKPVKKDRPKAVGGTRIWIKAPAVDAIRNPKPAFARGRLAKKSSNVSQSSDDVDSGSTVITRATKWVWKEGRLVDSSKLNITVSLDEESSDASVKPLIMPAKAMSGGDVVMANDYEMSKDGRPICPDDLISLTHLHEPSVVECLEHRYEDNRIYTSTGPILLALNPFKEIRGLYDDSTMKKYWGKAKDLPPHIYSIADNAFLTMMNQLKATKIDEAPVGCDQSILVSGESGAGKTVTTKFAMKYLAALSQRAKVTKETVFDSTEFKAPQDAAISRRSLSRRSLSRMSSRLDVMSQHSAASSESIETLVLQSNPILESFGNARTIRNDNSSRFGKFIEMQFTRKGRLVGASIEVYLLEKVRLVKASPGERNYHIFYELLNGDMDGSERDKYFIDRLASPEDFKLTATGTYTRRDGVEDDETYDDLMLAMHSMGFPKEEQSNIFTTVAAILHASNLTFLDIDGKSKLDDTNKHLKPVCNLLGVTPKDLGRALTQVTLSAGKTTLQKNLTVDKAIKGVEALMKAAYGTLFTYLVARVNEKISYKRKQCEDTGATIDNPAKDSAATIGVLDIFGFESFKTNSFEQLCINFCNESLQQQFNTFVLENEQAEYEREGINWSFIKFPSNQDVLDLIGKRGSGLLGVLDDQCKTPGTTDKSFALALYRTCKTHKRFIADKKQIATLKFSVNHYAGAVEYTTDDFIEKNRDELPKEATELLQNSTNPFIRHLASIIESSKDKASAKTTQSKAKKTKETVGGEFRRQLRHLREKIDCMTPHYVRCLKPNDKLVQNHFDRAAIVEQLRCNGIIEAVRVARAGFSNQFSHADFVLRYSSCVWKELKIRRVRPRKKARASSPKKRVRKAPRKVTPKECQDLLKLLYKKLQEENDDEDKNAEEDGDGDNKEKNIFKQKKKTSDLSSNLQKVGMQFGKTKVFVRHTAFENLERIRTQEHARAAVKLNSMFRMFLARTEYGQIRNIAHEARLKALAAENPEWGDPTFGKETLDRFEKNRHAFSGKSGQEHKPSKAATARPFDWVVENGVWLKKYLD